MFGLPFSVLQSGCCLEEILGNGRTCLNATLLLRITVQMTEIVLFYVLLSFLVVYSGKVILDPFTPSWLETEIDIIQYSITYQFIIVIIISF